MDRRTFLKVTGALGATLSLQDSQMRLLAQSTNAAMAPSGETAIPTFCAMCGPSMGCGINAIVRDGRFVRIEGMKEAPRNQGRNCPKAHAAPQWVYSPQRSNTL